MKNRLISSILAFLLLFSLVPVNALAEGENPCTEGHSPVFHAAVGPTCSEDGSSGYWQCSECEKYFSDELCENEIIEGGWVIPANGHNFVSGVCAVCNEPELPETPAVEAPAEELSETPAEEPVQEPEGENEETLPGENAELPETAFCEETEGDPENESAEELTDSAPESGAVLLSAGEEENILTETNFPDARFLAAIRWFLEEDTLTAAEAAEVTSLNVSGEGIESLAGIEFFTGLKDLRCSENYLKDIDIHANTSLTHLECDSNGLKALDVKNNILLTHLDCGNNDLTELDISANTALTRLFCHNNRLTALNVGAQSLLMDLNCAGNDLTGLDVNNNTALTFLSCSYNSIGSLYVGNNTALEQLECIDCGLTSLDVENNPALKELFCDENDLGVLDVSGNPALIQLNCYNCDLESLDLDKNTALEILVCGNDKLTGLDLSHLSNLTWLTCINTEISVLNLDYNSNLVTLECSGNKLTGLNLISCIELTDLDCHDNQITELMTGNSFHLEFIDCHGNDLSEINFGGMAVNLYSLNCSGNKLTKLDLNLMPSLAKLKCGAQKLPGFIGWANSEENAEAGIVEFSGIGGAFPECGVLYAVCGEEEPEDILTPDNFPDANFREALKRSLGVQKLTASWASEITGLDVSYCGICDLKGLEFFTALETLCCSNNELTYLDIYDCSALTYLDCSGNKLADLSIYECPRLEELNCCDNDLRNLSLRDIPALTMLACADNDLISLDLSGNPSLASLYCDNNALMNLDLSGNTALTSLYCAGNKLLKLDLSQNTGLYDVSCGSQDLKGFLGWTLSPENAETGLAEFTGEGDIPHCGLVYAVYAGASDKTNILTEAYIPDENFRNAIKAQYHVESLTAGEAAEVTDLDLSLAEIEDLSGIELFTGLTRLECRSSGLYAMDLSNNTALTYLDCIGCPLTALDISKNTALTYLNCSENRLTELDLSHNTALVTLKCMNNDLTGLDLSNNTLLQCLWCAYNSLSELDVSNNTVLTDLRCSGNQLSSLDVGNNSKLKYLECSANRLTELDLSNNSAMEYLDCSYNKLTVLNLWGNSGEVNIYCGGQKLRDFRGWITEPDHTEADFVDGVFDLPGSGVLYALWNSTQKEIVLTAFAEGVSGFTAPLAGAGVYDVGTEITVTASPLDGYSFTGWYKDGVCLSSEPEYTFTVEDDIGLRAVYRAWPSVIAVITGADKITTGKSTVLHAELSEVPEEPLTYAWTLKDGDGDFAALKENGDTVLLKAASGLTETKVVTVILELSNGFRTEKQITIVPVLTGITLKVDDEAVNGRTFALDLNTRTELTVIPSADPADALLNVKWTCSDTKGSFCTFAVNSDGSLTASFRQNAKAGTVTFTAKDTITLKKASFKVSVKRLSTGIEITSGTDVTLIGGKSLKLTAALQGNPTNKSVVWSIPDEYTAYASISKGVLKAVNVTETQQIVINVRTADGNCSASAAVTIVPKTRKLVITAADNGITNVVKGSYTKFLNTGDSLTLDASVLPIEAGGDVVWSGIKTAYGTFTRDGNRLLITNMNKTGTITLTAKSKDNGAKASVKLTIARYADTVELRGSKSQLLPEGFRVRGGSSYTFKAKLASSAGVITSKALVWSVDCTDYASISQSGKLTVKSLTEDKTLTVRVALKADSSIYDERTITLAANTASAIHILMDGKVVNGTTQTVELKDGAAIVDANAFGLAGDITWKPVSEKGAACWKDGFLVFLRPGTVTVTASGRNTAGKTVKASFKLKVLVSTEDLAISSKTGATELTGGKKLQMLASFTPDKPTNSKVVWSLAAEDAPYASISSKGLITAKQVTDRHVITVSCRSADNGTEAEPVPILIAPAAKTVNLYLEGGRVNGKKLDFTDELKLTVTNSPLTSFEKWKVSTSNKAVFATMTGNELTLTRASGSVIKVGARITVTVTAADGSGKIAKVTLVAEKLPVSPKDPDNKIGEQVIICASDKGADDPEIKTLHWMSDQLYDATEGRYSIEVYPDGMLGVSDEILVELMNGVIGMGLVSNSVITSHAPDFAILEAPYVFDSLAHQELVFESGKLKPLFTSTESLGFTVLSAYTLSERNLFLAEAPVAEGEVVGPDDLRGLNIRVMFSETVPELGANSVYMAWADVPAAILAGVIDGAEDTIVGYLDYDRYLVAPVYVNTGHLSVPYELVINTALLRSMSEADRAVLLDICAVSQSHFFNLASVLRSEYAAKATAQGVTFFEADRAAFRALNEDQILEKANVSALSKSTYQAILECLG